MTNQKNEWYYADEEKSEWVGPMTLGQLDGLRESGTIEDYTDVVNKQMLKQEGPQASGIRYAAIARINVDFTPSIEGFFEARKNHESTVLSGPNNSGKTLLLKQLFSLVGPTGYLLGCNRFSHVDVLNTREVDKHQHRTHYDSFLHEFHTSRQNTENNRLNLQEVITSLNDTARSKLFSVAEELLGNSFSLKKTDADNTFSPYYVDVDGENLRYSSTGTRLVLLLLGVILDERFSTLLLDEPEIGLSPRIQLSLAKFLYDPDRRREFCPHLKQVFISTHSHLFLDINHLGNNFLISKAGNSVSISAATSPSDVHQLQFSMLGNELESLFLPSAIVVVEGDSDVTFLRKVFQTKISDRKVTVVAGGGDGGIQNKLNFLREAFGEIADSPYHDRLFVVLDKTHSLKKDRLVNQGVAANNIFVWSENGIEYFYPVSLLAEAFRCDVSDVALISLESDPIVHNGIRFTKRKLASFVTDRVESRNELPEEIEGLLASVSSVCFATQ